MSKRCFWISNTAIDALIRAKVSAEHICIYLVLANFVDNRRKIKGIDNQTRFSTAGLTAIKNYTGIYDLAEIKGLLDDLENIMAGEHGSLITNPDRWNHFANEYNSNLSENDKKANEITIINNVGAIYDVSFAINGCNDYRDEYKYVSWFPDTLVEGISFKTSRESMERPLRTILQHDRLKDIAARMLLLFYRNNDPEGYGGVRAAKTLYLKYEKDLLFEKYGFNFWATKNSSLCFTETLLSVAFGDNHGLQETKKKALLEEAYELLIIKGYIYVQIMALNGDAQSKYTAPRYILTDKHNKHGYNPPFTGGFLSIRAARIIEDLLRKEGYGVASDYGESYRFINDRYPVMFPKMESLEVAGIVRLRLDATDSPGAHNDKLCNFENNCRDYFAKMKEEYEASDAFSKKDDIGC